MTGRTKALIFMGQELQRDRAEPYQKPGPPAIAK
jgi:hypothetical protein